MGIITDLLWDIGKLSFKFNVLYPLKALFKPFTW